MKITFRHSLTLTVLVASQVASAANAPAFSSSSESPYQQLENLYTNGVKPDFEPIDGWWSGRCYRSSQPSDAIAAALVMRMEKVGEDGGVLFPPQYQKAMHMLIPTFESYPSNWFDQMSSLVKRVVENVSAKDTGTFQESEDALDLVYADDGKTTMSLKQAPEDIYVARGSYTQNDGSLKTFAFCYYFKKVAQ